MEKMELKVMTKVEEKLADMEKRLEAKFQVQVSTAPSVGSADRSSCGRSATLSRSEHAPAFVELKGFCEWAKKNIESLSGKEAGAWLQKFFDELDPDAVAVIDIPATKAMKNRVRVFKMRVALKVKGVGT